MDLPIGGHFRVLTFTILQIVRTESSLIPQSPFTRRRRGLGKLGKKLVNPFWGVEEDNESDNCDDSMLSNMSVRGRLVVNRIPHQDDVDRASGIEEEIGDEESQSQNNKTRRRSTQYRLQALDVSLANSFNVGVPRIRFC